MNKSVCVFYAAAEPKRKASSDKRIQSTVWNVQCVKTVEKAKLSAIKEGVRIKFEVKLRESGKNQS